MAIILAIIGAIVIVSAICLTIWFIRARRFKPTKDKEKQKDMLNADLEGAGFAYEPRGDYFYSLMNCWQRKTGYCRLYDESAPLFSMIMDCEPVTFSYGGKRWLIELWKGQYGITTGAEIGIYNTSREDVQTDRFTGTFYESISDAERLPLSFVLRRNKTVMLRRKARHWWLTGFKLGAFSNPSSLVMDAKIKFPNRRMCAAFTESLRGIGYTKDEFAVFRTTVTIHYDKPHTQQPPAQKGISKAVVQQTNENNCRLYEFATAGYTDTLDKLELLKSTLPELYQFFLNSLYSKAFFDAFDWLLDLIFGHHPTPVPPAPPIPPSPTDPSAPPYPPCPPCRPCRDCQSRDCAYTRPVYQHNAYAARYLSGSRRRFSSPICEYRDFLYGETDPSAQEGPPCRR